MEDLFKALIEFVVEATFHFLVGAVELGLHQCRPRIGYGIILCILPLIAMAVVIMEISASGASVSNILFGSAVVGLFSWPSVYCFLTRNVGQ